MLGVRSGRRSCTPKVDDKKLHDPVRSHDIWRRVKRVPTTTPTEPKAELTVDLESLVGGRLSWQRRMSGGRRSIGYMERYEAMARANMLVNCAPTTARETAYKMAHVVKTFVGCAMHTAMVNGLSRKLV